MSPKVIRDSVYYIIPRQAMITQKKPAFAGIVYQILPEYLSAGSFHLS